MFHVRSTLKAIGIFSFIFHNLTLMFYLSIVILLRICFVVKSTNDDYKLSVIYFGHNNL